MTKSECFLSCVSSWLEKTTWEALTMLPHGSHWPDCVAVPCLNHLQLREQDRHDYLCRILPASLFLSRWGWGSEVSPCRAYEHSEEGEGTAVVTPVPREGSWAVFMVQVREKTGSCQWNWWLKNPCRVWTWSHRVWGPLGCGERPEEKEARWGPDLCFWHWGRSWWHSATWKRVVLGEWG